MDALKEHAIQIDFDAGKLAFLKNIQRENKSLGSYIAMRYPGGGTPYIVGAASTDHVSEFIVDTGSTRTALLHTRAFSDLVAAGRIQMLSESRRQSAFGASRVITGRNEVLAVKGFQIYDPIVASGNLNCLGLGFWSRFVVTFDFPKNGLYLKKGKRFQERDQFDQSGLHLLRKDGKVLVHSVDQKSPATTAGIKAEDTIIAINNEEVGGVSMFALRRRLSLNSKTLDLTISRGGEQMKVSMSTQNDNASKK